MIQQLELSDVADARTALTSFPIDGDRYTLEGVLLLDEAVNEVETRLLLGKIVPWTPIGDELQAEIDAWRNTPQVIDAAPVVKAIE